MERVRKDRGIINRQERLDIYKEEYWGLTEKVMVNYNIRENRKKGEMNDEEMLQKIMNEYEMDKKKNYYSIYRWI